MQQSITSAADSFSTSQESPYILCNPEVYYVVCRSLPFLPNLSQIKPIHFLPSYLLKLILILSSHLCLSLPIGLFHRASPPKLFSPICDTCLQNKHSEPCVLKKYVNFTFLCSTFRCQETYFTTAIPK